MMSSPIQWRYFATPDLSHLSESNYETIYDPSQETLQFMDGLQSDYDMLNELCPDICVEVGSGSGALITFLARMLNTSGGLNLATDVNFAATEVTVETGRRNGVGVSAVCADLLQCMLPRLRHKVDVLIFNPPYIDTASHMVSKPGNYEMTANITELLDDNEQGGGGTSLSASYAGGKRGREVMDRLFPHIDHLLSPRGLFYLACVEENDVPDIRRNVERHGAFTMTIVQDNGGNLDNPYCLRFQRTKGTPQRALQLL